MGALEKPGPEGFLPRAKQGLENECGDVQTSAPHGDGVTQWRIGVERGCFAMPDSPKIDRGQALQRPYLNTSQAAHILGIGWRKLQRLRVTGAGPRFRRHGRLIYYHVDDLEIWSRSTADSGSSDA